MAQKILICDDSGMARKQMSRALPSDWDVEVTFAEHGEDALEKIRAGDGDLLFLDLNMPVLDGYGVLEAISKADLPVMTIVVSGDIQPEARSRVQKLGAMDFIKKPTDPDRVRQILTDFGLYREGEALAPAVSSPATGGESVQQARQRESDGDGKLSLQAYLQEMANVAMGQAADLLARLLDVFVKLPVPRVAMISRSELAMALTAAADDQKYSAVCQGFTGAGMGGEALLLFSDSSFDDMATLLRYDSEDRQALEVELLMDMSSILFGAFLKGLGAQMDIHFGLSHPSVIGRHRKVNELLEYHQEQDEQLMSIEISYEIEDHEIVCDLLVLLTADSLPQLKKTLQYVAE